jgi:CheY-like chemotaxis protein
MTNCRVILIEDNCDDEFLAIRALGKLGINDVTVARDGREAVTLLLGEAGKNPPLLPEFVLLDLRLPKLDGLDVLRMLRDNEATTNLPIFVLTSSEDPSDKEACHKHGVLAMLSKPLDVEELGGLLSQLP